jgi:dipeptidyl aminopeptidase/acylaminoacyl peptidase
VEVAADVAPEIADAADTLADLAEGDADDAATDAEPDPLAGPLAWESVELVSHADGVICERVSYDSQGLTIEGQVCRPEGAGAYPVVMYNHGGALGIGSWEGGTGKRFAQSGYAVFASSYRGEDESDGEVEVCQGEVVDIIRMYRIAKAQPYADPTRTAIVGQSHGGCNTLRVLARGETFTAAVDVFGVPSWPDAYEALKALELISEFQQLRQIIVAGIGGTPSQVPEAWAERSPITYAAELARVEVPLLILQGELDPLVKPKSQCRFVAAVGGFKSWRVGLNGSPQACWGTGVVFEAGEGPALSFPDARTLLVFPAESHAFSTTLVDRALAFLADKLSEVEP